MTDLPNSLSRCQTAERTQISPWHMRFTSKREIHAERCWKNLQGLDVLKASTSNSSKVVKAWRDFRITLFSSSHFHLLVYVSYWQSYSYIVLHFYSWLETLNYTDFHNIPYIEIQKLFYITQAKKLCYTLTSVLIIWWRIANFCIHYCFFSSRLKCLPHIAKLSKLSCMATLQ